MWESYPYAHAGGTLPFDAAASNTVDATVAPASATSQSMQLRVRKRAAKSYRNEEVSPDSKAINKKIWDGLVSPKDKKIVAAIEDVDDGKMGSQDVLAAIKPFVDS